MTKKKEPSASSAAKKRPAKKPAKRRKPPFRISPQRQKFLDHYLIHNDQRAAARHAGYKGSDQAMWSRANAILNHPEIQKIVAAARQKIQEASFATATDKRRMLMDVAQRCMQEVEPERDADGNETGVFKFDSRAVIAAVAELNKMDGDHAAIKQDVTINEGVADRLEAALKRGKPAVDQ